MKSREISNPELTYQGGMLESIIETVSKVQPNPMPADDDEIMLEHRLRLSRFPLSVDEVLGRVGRMAG